MATDPLEQLSQEFQDISAVYEQEFAGQTRQTRDLERLESLMGQLRGLVARVERAAAALQGEALGRLRAEALETLAMYEAERRAIAEAKALGPQYAEFMLLATLANQVFARYGRHFAGHPRSTRDLGLLDEMVTDLRALRQRMREVMKKKEHAAFQRDVDLVTQQLDLYAREREAVAAAQAEGSPEERAGLLAGLANAQFDAYRANFAGRARVTRRPGLLQRICDRLRHVQAAMVELGRGGFASEENAANVQIVEQNVSMYEKELAEIKKARQATPMRDLMGLLGGAANEIFEQYRAGFAGKPRGEVDLALLGAICDQLGEIARQMADFHRVQKDEMNAKNLEIVNAQLASYEREFTLVLQAQREAAGAAGG
jgi:hypothetical protein